ncbi:MAG TPA: hypothetical protein VHA78_04675 [Candidatus Peribacteraceae bacterium]|nr:hypothetical protein [Candidatus Peribacteraceae bacterium]
MRRGLRAVFLAILLGLSSGTAFARDPLTIQDQNPQDFQSVQNDLQKIPPYLAQVQCGGWNLNESVDGKIAQVSGVPGHFGQWDGNIVSGMGTRVGSFQFPDSARGLTSACLPGYQSIEKSRWVPDPTETDPLKIKQEDVVFPHPLFGDPSCRWRLKKDDGSFSDQAPDIPLKTLDSYDPPPQYGQMQTPQDGTNLGIDPGDRQSPINCQDFSNYLNTFQYLDCLCPQTNPDTGDMDCPQDAWGNRYLCTDQSVTNLPADCYDPGLPAPVDDQPQFSNSLSCSGQECRCMQTNQPGELGCVSNPSTILTQESPVYYSFFRQYTGSFTRDSVPSDGPDDDTSRDNVPVACFGFYDEFDPLTHQTQQKDRRCVIDIDVSTMRKSQAGKGEYGQKSSQVDVDPEAKANQRSEASSDGSDGPLWFTKLGWGFSLLNESTFQNDTYNEDLTNVFLNTNKLDTAKMTASWPVANPGQNPTTARSDLLRSFDDTGDKRIIANWWQKQQTTVATLLHPVVVRLLLPPGYSFGVDPTNPIFGQAGSSSSTATDLRSRRMEVQIGATEDTLGDAIKSIQSSLLLHLDEEPVPVLVPFGSPTDFRAKAQAWCSWYMAQALEQDPEVKPDCDNAPPDVKDFIDKLNAYADDIEQERVLRAQLAMYAGKILQLQQKLSQPISDWVKQNLTTYRDFLSQQKSLNQGVSDSWRDAQTAMSTFHDQTNMPWCMNQRFETPIYSLLDRWLPSRSLGSDAPIAADGLPQVPEIPVPQDIIVDFSHIVYLTGSLKLPVLRPVQVALTVNEPTAGTTLANFSEHLPDFPSLNPVVAAMNNSMAKLPKVQTGASFPPLKLPPIDSSQISAVLSSIQQITQLIGGNQSSQSSPSDDSMNATYDAFWKSIGPLNDQGGGDPYDPSKSCDAESIKNLKGNAQCCGWSDRLCQHVEMDLMERFQRIGSRKLVMLKEDYQSTGAARMTPDTCLPSDQTCLILHGEKPQDRYQVQINPPKNGMPDLTTDAKKAIRNATLPAPAGNVSPADFPPYTASTGELLQIEDVPRPIDLTPPSSSSSSK